MTYDVLVVGAGPAGSSLALRVAEKGASVALIDADSFPRPKCCAGWLNGRAVKRLKFLDTARRRTKATPFRHLVFHTAALDETAVYSSRGHLGYIVDRARFDADLVRQARAAGATPMLGKAVKAIQTGEREVSVALEGGKEVVGRLLIGADGTQSHVARAGGLRERWGPAQLVHCLAADVPLTKTQARKGLGSAQIHIAPAFEEAPGYAWVFPGNGHASVGIGVRGAAAAKRLPALYALWVKRLVEAGKVPEKPELASPCGAAVPAGAAIEFEHHVGKRTLLIGDAGGFAAAASGEGIWPGIQSAELAAKCVLRALKADRPRSKGADTCQDELLRFKHQWRQKMAPYLQMPNVNVQFLLPLVFTNQEIADRFAKAFLFGEHL